MSKLIEYYNKIEELTYFVSDVLTKNSSTHCGTWLRIVAVEPIIPKINFLKNKDFTIKIRLYR